jgi:hypothetical protein
MIARSVRIFFVISTARSKNGAIEHKGCGLNQRKWTPGFDFPSPTGDLEVNI